MPGRGAAAGTGTPGKRGLLAPPHSSARSLSLRLPRLPVCKQASCICSALRSHWDLQRKAPPTGPSGEEWGQGQGAVFIKSERT